MPRIEFSLRVRAPAERCFDLSRSIDLHLSSAAATGERAVAGVTTGLIGAGEEVTWSARHLGVRQRLTSRITAFERPRHFRDSMVRGAFTRFDHDHFFVPDGEFTVMREVFDFRAPGGALGRLLEWVLLTRYLEGFLRARAEVIRRVAEGEEWEAYLEGRLP